MHPVCHFFPNSASARLLLLVLLFPWCWGCCCSYSRFFPPLSSGVRITLSWPSTSFPPRLFQSWSLSVPALLSDYRKCHSCLKCTYFIWGIKLTIYLLSITFPYSQLLKNKVEHLGRKSLIYKWLFLLAFFFLISVYVFLVTIVQGKDGTVFEGLSTVWSSIPFHSPPQFKPKGQTNHVRVCLSEGCRH